MRAVYCIAPHPPPTHVHRVRLSCSCVLHGPACSGAIVQYEKLSSAQNSVTALNGIYTFRGTKVPMVVRLATEVHHLQVPVIVLAPSPSAKSEEAVGEGGCPVQ